jgi:DNA polymerase I
MPPVLYLIDGHALAYRTYFALTRGAGSRFVTQGGEHTAGVYGFTSVLFRIFEQEHPDYLAVAFDRGRTFRDDLYSEYKGTREKMPDDLRPQIERIREIVDAFNIPRLEKEGYEADDVLGSVSKIESSKGLGVKIITGDRDLLQLVDERIIINLPGKSLSESKDYFADDVREYMGVRPDQIVDYKALVGDSSDNIPGVSGIGKKTGISLLEKYNDLDNIYTHLEDLSPSIKKKLENDRENAYLSKKLAQIVTDLDIPIDLKQARPQKFDPEQVERIFRELEFRSLMNRLSGLLKDYGIQTKKVNQQLSMFGEAVQPFIDNSNKNLRLNEKEKLHQTIIVNTSEALVALVKLLNQAEHISFDTETDSTNQMDANLVGISLAIEPDTGYYIPLGHKNSSDKQLAIQDVLEALRAPLSDMNIPKVGHNIKYDFVVLARYGLRVKPLSFDTMIAEWLINPDSHNLGLKNLAWVRLGIQMTTIEELIGKGKKQITMADVPISKVASYATADALVVLKLIPELKEELKDRKAVSLLQELEMPLVDVLADMEMVGVGLDVQFLKDMSVELNVQLIGNEDKIYEFVGEPFNLNSPQQLSTALFDRLKIEPPDSSKRTASGFYSTAASVLDELKGNHPVIDLVLDYRELSKLKSTYLDALPLEVNHVTKRIHTSFNQTGSVTGRLASSKPNLQNIPIRTEIGRRVREAFIASPGKILIAVDYSQIELRIVAHMADDRDMQAAFLADKDIHAATASAIYGVPLGDVNKDQRRRAKGINFGLIYGMSAFGLSRYTDLTLGEAEDFMVKYFRQFPGIKNYLDEIPIRAAKQGYVETLFGRRRYFPSLMKPSNRNLRMREEREAINAPIQGTAADIMKMAMIKVASALADIGSSAKMILQVHDELVLESPLDELAETVELVKSVMESAYRLNVPLKTETNVGKNWGMMEKYG